MDVESVSFGAWLREQLDRRGWRVTDLADRMGVRPATVSNWARDRRHPSPHSCERIADALDLPRGVVLAVAGWPVGSTVPVSGVEIIDLRLERIERLVRSEIGELDRDLRAGPRTVPIRVVGVVPADRTRWGTLEGGRDDVLRVPDWMVTGARAPFGIRVRGDCLIALGIRDGDVVVCDVAPEGCEPENGRVVFVRVGSEVTLKRWYRHADTIELRDGDGALAARLSIMDDIEVLGVTRGLLRRQL